MHLKKIFLCVILSILAQPVVSAWQSREQLRQLDDRAKEHTRRLCSSNEWKRYTQSLRTLDSSIARRFTNIMEGVGPSFYLVFLAYEIALLEVGSTDDVTALETAISGFVDMTVCSRTFVPEVAADLEAIRDDSMALVTYGFGDFVFNRPNVLSAYQDIARKIVPLLEDSHFMPPELQEHLDYIVGLPSAHNNP